MECSAVPVGVSVTVRSMLRPGPKQDADGEEILMGREGVAAALEKMIEDSEAADRLASGDFTDLPDVDLTEAERALVSAAAGEVPSTRR